MPRSMSEQGGRTAPDAISWSAPPTPPAETRLRGPLVVRTAIRTRPRADRARGAGLSLPARGPMSSRGSYPGYLNRGAHPPSPERVHQGSLQPWWLSAGSPAGKPVPRDPFRPAAMTMESGSPGRTPPRNL